MTIRVSRYGSGVGFYREHILPRLVDRACGTAGMTSWRAGVSDGLRGRVVEIGFGSGLSNTIQRRSTLSSLSSPPR